MRIVWGIFLGGGWAVVDVLLLRLLTRASQRQPERAGSFLARGLAARYLLGIAVLAVGFLLPQTFDPLWVILPLIIQKVVVVAAAVFQK